MLARARPAEHVDDVIRLNLSLVWGVGLEQVLRNTGGAPLPYPHPKAGKVQECLKLCLSAVVVIKTLGKADLAEKVLRESRVFIRGHFLVPVRLCLELEMCLSESSINLEAGSTKQPTTEVPC